MKSFQKTIKTIFSLFIFSMILGSANVQSQVSLGTDVVSRYIWRGLDFGQSMTYQPALSYSKGGFEVGAWGSYAFNDASANELDIWASYSIELSEETSLSLGVTDYFFPSAPGAYFDFNQDGSHIIEPFIGYSGVFSVTAYMNVLNDPDNSVYINASYPFELDEVSLEAFIGFVPGESALYGTTGATIQDIGLSASKSIVLTDSFSLPVGVSYIVNPSTETGFLVFGFSL